jgi:cytochrome c peroxidase
MADDGKSLYIACLDSDELLVVDPSADAEHASSCAKTLKERVRVKVESPTDVALDSDRKAAVVFSTFSRRLSVVPLAHTDEVSAVVLPRRAPLGELIADGRRLFHRSADPRIARNGRACASCHVDGRDDGLVWPTPLGKRQTPMLAGRIAETAPYGWNGEHPSLVAHIKSTVKNLDGTGLNDPELDALAAYVASMKAPSKRNDASDAAAGRGKTVFASNEAGCSSCHTEATRFTDLETHTLGKIGPAFDTPSLAFVGQTAPYFHDGRFKTLEELIDGCEGVMGKTKHLSPDSRQDLVAYLRTL